MLTLLPFVLLIGGRWPRYGLLALTAVVVLASFAGSIRSHVALGVLLAAAAVVVMHWRLSWRVVPALAVLGVAYISVSGFAIDRLRDHRDDRAGVALSDRAAAGHTLWHPAYLGLGYVSNPYGIRFNDTIGIRHATVKRPGVRYLTPAYERTVRELFFDVAEDDPGYVAEVTVKKALVVVGESAPYLLIVALFVPAMLLVGTQRVRRRRWVALIAPSLAIGLIPPILAIPLREYELGLFGALGLLGLLGIGWAAARLQDELPALRDRAAPVRTVLRRGAEAARAPGPARVVAVIALVAVLALPALFATALALRAEHDRWGTAIPTASPEGPAR